MRTSASLDPAYVRKALSQPCAHGASGANRVALASQLRLYMVVISPATTDRRADFRACTRGSQLAVVLFVSLSLSSTQAP
jgi:hypothetical protein